MSKALLSEEVSIMTDKLIEGIAPQADANNVAVQGKGTLLAYSQIEFWLNLVFQRGALAVAEVAGTLFVFRNLAQFQLAPALLGAGLLTIAIIVEYVVWTKTSSFMLRRIDQLEAVKEKVAVEQAKLLTAVLASRPGAPQ